MASPVRPKGPLPQRVYWVRRAVVLGVPLALVAAGVQLLGGSSGDSQEPATATQASSQTSSTPAPTAGPTAAVSENKSKNKNKRRKKKAEAAEPTPPPPPSPSGPCSDAEVVATPAVAQVAGGADIALTLNLRTQVTEACTWQASPDTLTVTITSGPDRIWSSRECPRSIAPQDVVVYRDLDTPVVVTWSGRRSDETCSRLTEWALPGWYHVEAAALGGEPTDVQFELVAPQAPVVTEAPEPKQQRTKKGRSHQAGQSGGGTSEPNG